MRWIARVLAVACVLAAGMGQAQAPPRRVALVIGNAAYTTPGWALVNPVNDATLIADRLRGLGFEVDPVMNASKAQMEAAFARFGAKLKSSGADAVGFFYYAGHGAQKDGVNLLVPVDVTARTMDQLRYQAPPMQFLLDDMADAGNAVNIIILDACRNVPLLDGQRSGGSGGLAEFTQAPPDVLIAYATRAGYTAPDNPGESNSVFTRTLAEALQNDAGDPLELMFSDVQAKVFAATAGAQRPEYRSGLVRAPRWSFRPGAARVSQPAPLDLEPIPDARTTPRLLRGTVLAAGHSLGEFAQFRDCADCPDMIMLPSGQLNIGAPATEAGRQANEGPQRVVGVDRFAIGRFEVTFYDWDQCVKGGGCRSNPQPSDNGWGRGSRPVINVSWSDAQEYAAWLSQKTGKTYRLPSEVEWEYAARGRVTQARFFWGADEARSCRYANTAAACDDGFAAQTAGAGSFPMNAWGLYDVAGNVAEWTADCYEPQYPATLADVGAEARTGGDCARHPVRGGAWNSPVVDTRSAVRQPVPAGQRAATIGFRIARAPY